jgi:hypothetical protein
MLLVEQQQGAAFDGIEQAQPTAEAALRIAAARGSNAAVAVFAGELERAGGVLAGAVDLAACGERFGPAEVRACRPYEQAVARLDLDRACEVLVGLIVAAERGGEQAPVGEGVTFGDGTVPHDQVTSGLDEFVEDLRGVGITGLRSGVREQRQRGRSH